MNLRRLAPVFWLLAFPVLASPVAADCQAAGPIEDELTAAEVAFVGTVTQVVGGSARFTVREVWAGDLGPEVDVVGLGWNAPGRGGPAEVVTFVEDDRQWQIGEMYLVLPVVDEGVLRDNICTATTLWSDELAALRPAGAQILPAEGYEPVSMPIIPIGLGVVVLMAVSLLAFRHWSR
jgi:hypothetical protein